MYDYKGQIDLEPWKTRIAAALSAIMREAGEGAVRGNAPGGSGNAPAGVSPSEVIAEIPPNPEMGDFGFPMFSFAKLLRKGPPEIARMVCAKLSAGGSSDGSGVVSGAGEHAAGGRGATESGSVTGDAAAGGTFRAIGPYVNVNLDRGETAGSILRAILAVEDNTGGGKGAADGSGRPSFGRPGTLAGKRIMVEFSSPNTNKPLHLGHLRNDVLGESISRILAACGAEVRKVCIINDRGIHICKSMLAYKERGEGKTPESEGIKSDHFVGDWYVRFSQDLKHETEAIVREKGLDKKAAEAEAPLLLRAQELLRKWEAGENETVELWKKMNDWTIGGMKETYRRTGVSFDQYYFESQTYLLGKDEVLKGLERGLFYREPDGAVAVDLSAEKLDKKILLRSDGTSIYITQDFGTAIHRHKDWPFDQLVYVVGSEQQYHFKVLFVLLDKLGYPWAKNLYHLSYGMVNLPEGKMKSREGTVVDADDLIDSLRDMALEEIRSKEREEEVGDPRAAAEKIAVGALHYFLLHISPSKDMLFDPKESLSFNGNTGPYLQYMGARISSLLRKAAERNAAGTGEAPRFNLLSDDAEWELVKTLAAYNDTVAAAAAGMDSSLVTAYLYELAKGFSRFYHDCPILAAEEPGLAEARLALCRAVLKVLRDALDLVCIPFLEAM